MSIRTKLLVACILLVAVNVGAGVYSQLSQQRIAALGIDIYDRAFMAMSYLRSAQNGLSKLRAGVERLSPQALAQNGNVTGGAGAASQATAHLTKALDALANGDLPDILDDVQVANGRAMSSEGADATRDIGQQLAALETALRTHDLAATRAKVEQIQTSFDTAVEIYAGDGYVYRRDVQRLVDHSFTDTGAAMTAAAAIALAITLVLGASIVPSLRNAVGVARAISAGQLDRTFTTRGSDEIAVLMRALSDMRDSLVEKISRIDALAIESHVRAAELSIQNGRFEAALDNMHHGLCLVDAEHRLIVANRRFTDMFGEVEIGAAALPLFTVGGTEASDTAVEKLVDGRVIRIVSRPVLDGGWVVTFEDVTDRHRAEARLQHMSHHDSLTGLPNRLLFGERMAQAVEEVGPPPGPALLYIDLDGFKSVNDTLGHAVGDDLLRGVAARLQRQLGPEETIARLGGDEFALILKSGDAVVVEDRARQLVAALQRPFHLGAHDIAVGASIGVAVRSHADGVQGEDPCALLLKKADVALYRAKAEGKGTFRTHSDELDAAIAERRALEIDLHMALERQELVLLFQPIVRATDGRPTGFEALLRWHHPTRGIVPPATFIPIAEETGIITAIGRWVLRTACAEAAGWPADVRVAVNLSAVQFRQGFLAADVRHALVDAQLAPERLELEITESVLLQDKDTVVATLFQLRASGVRIALDDFGTGYSSLSYLRKFPFDKLKIDRSFVQNIVDAESAAILRAMVGLGKALNVAVVAEGIETVEQADRLRQEGCTELQGFLFGRPGPAAQVPIVILGLISDVAEPSRMAG